MSTNFTAVNGLLAGIPKLKSDNWFEWYKKMNMFFLGAGVTGISSGKAPTEKSALEKWEATDRQMTAFIYLKVEDEFHYLIEDLESGAEAWEKLKAHFERSTMGQRMAARQEFYEITHDPSRPVATYVQAITAGRKKMEALGCKIEDDEVKDVLLMHLDSSFLSIRTIILAQSTEPTLDQVKNTLLSSSAVDSVDIKMESQDVALAARGRAQRPGGGGREGVVDGEYQWCDPNNNGCHRCGRPGHQALRCMFNMPQHVKDRLTGTNRRTSSHSPPHSSSHHHSHAAQTHPRSHEHTHSTNHHSHPAEHSYYTHHRYGSQDSAFDPDLDTHGAGPLQI